MLRDGKDRFTGAGQNYDLYRPSYPASLIDWIVKTALLTPSSIVADVGCGTGIASRLFAERGYKVIGIDPNDEMLSYARARGGNATYQNGSSDETGLEEHSVNLVTAAQAFHWFPITKTLKEFKRILVPGGYACAFWNQRENKGIGKAYEELVTDRSKDYKKIPGAKEMIPQIREHELVKNPQEGAFEYSQTFTKEGFIGRAYSTSYVNRGVKNHDEFKKKLADIFDQYQENGNASFTYQTLAICFQLS